MPGVDRAAEETVRIRRALQRLSMPGALGGATLGPISGLEIDVDGFLRIDIAQNPSILFLNAAGLNTQYVTVSGAVPNISILVEATGTGQALVEADAGGTVRLQVPGTFLNMSATQAVFGSGATSFEISSATGLIGTVDTSLALIFKIDDANTGSTGIQIDGTLASFRGFYASFADGTPILIQPQTSSGAAPENRVQGATGDSVVGGNVIVQGGDAINSVNTEGGAVYIIGGLPTGNAHSHVYIQAQNSTPATVTIIECKANTIGLPALGFFGTSPQILQTADRTAASILAGLALYGLLTDSGSPTEPQADLITSTGANTWNKPAGAQWVLALIIGGGCGGGGGRRGIVASARLGGTGGGGGAVTLWSGPASLLGGSETVTIGAGGNGGANATVDDTDGGAGTAGGDTTFGAIATAKGGQGGAAGTATAPAASGSFESAGTHPGGFGALATAAVAGVTPPRTSGGAGGGGAGASISAAGATVQASRGGHAGGNGLSGGAAGAGSAGGAGSDATTDGYPGSGAGGGATTFDGGQGGYPGGGGGGGGASTNGTNSGAGKAGRDGLALIITYFSP
jgi:hypothetical protein